MNDPTNAHYASTHEALELSAHDRIRLAAEAAVCPATIRKFLSGRMVRSTSRARIERALRALGMATSRPTRVG